MEPSNVLIVTGAGEAAAPPDIAQITLGVEQRSQDPKQAITFVNQTMQSIIAALQANGIDQRDLQTSQINMHLEEQPPSIVPPPAPVAAPAPVEPSKATHRASAQLGKGVMTQPEPISMASTPPLMRDAAPSSNTYRTTLYLTVKLRNLQRVGETLSAAFAAGANASHGLNLTWEHPNPWFDKARLAAIADAKRRARELSRIDNLELERVISVSEQNCGVTTMGPQWAQYGIPAAPMAASFSGMPLERGELTAHCTVRVAYAIKQ